jgi:hypothetical protein
VLGGKRENLHARKANGLPYPNQKRLKLAQ